MKRVPDFCITKYRSMLFASTLSMAIMYLMLLCDVLIAGLMFGADAVVAVNLVAPLIGVVSFISVCIPGGETIIYTRAIGEMDKDKADKIYSTGLIGTAFLAITVPAAIILLENTYFRIIGATGDIVGLARAYYYFLPLEAALTIVESYLEQAIFSDGDEQLETLCYVSQIGGNILLSIILAHHFGICGIMLGTVIGDALSLIVVCLHFFKKTNTLHFVPFFSWKDIAKCIQYSIVDSITYLIWGIVDLVLISYISVRYDEKYLVVLAVVMSLLELEVIFDGIGSAIQPLIGVYFGEKNHVMVRRLMHTAIKSAIVEGLTASVVIFIFAPLFARLFGINDSEMIDSTVTAIRIGSLTLTFSSLFMLETSYYLYIDHLPFAVISICLKDGVFSILLPIIFSLLFGVNGMWIGFALASAVGMLMSLLLLYIHVGKKDFPWLLGKMNGEISVYNKYLSQNVGAEMSQLIEKLLLSHGYSKKTAMKAGLFAEEISNVLYERNSQKDVLVEYSVTFDEDKAKLIIRDSGVIFDITDPDLEIKGLSSFVLNGLMNAQKEKDYIPTTGYNKNMIQFPK